MAPDPPKHPQVFRTVAERIKVIQLIEKYVQSEPKMDLYALVPEATRRIPPKWTRMLDGKSNYYSYGNRCNVLEINPNTPLQDSKLSKYVGDVAPRWVEAKYLWKFFELATFYHGGIDEEYIWKALPGILQGQRENDEAQKIVRHLARLDNHMYTRMIRDSIKPITLHFLRNGLWATFDNEGRLPPFFEQEDRLRYFRYCLYQEPWMVAWWLMKCVPNMLRLSFLYQAEEITTNPFLKNLQSCLLKVFEDRFLLLVDATYLYQIDQEITKEKPKWDEGKKEIQQIMKSLSTHPTLSKITPDLLDLPIHSDLHLHGSTSWR
ncbi:hypothetical protein MBM_02427 [Drepanopeziza brunnea f. sp. 'multigermtubi' MB_m1]|uniref:Uncharacterized protein n=1 Tax=Marssonina brunnea f. sp. multigermtubi (strain MB_m1) TaxID=1072389 RepID=K1WNG6_MARBU|nr:uncharacterized protein MBM_02427 [Drepanopeziza brunnea f. sp. 'multigermtubi' MB_m1]EKD19190.1 hypothetical protein MBM_02427 [Drepanopeziza brunnea f. sp. 'multigermtubi' MB_m1]